MTAQVQIYRFGAFEIRVRSREIYKHGIRLKLRPQPFRVLEVLVGRASEVVTREELRQILWPGETFVDFEHGLNTSVKELRRVLGDSASEPRYIETLPRLGYRLIVPVSAEEPTAAEDRTADAALRAVGRRNRLPHLTLLLAGGSLLLLAAIAGTWGWLRARNPSQVAGVRLMLAVLPFENLTGDSSQDYVSDGLTEEMIGELGRLNPDRLGIIARTSVMHYKGSPARIAQIGRELGVQYVLEGSIRKQGDNLRISAQLIRVRDETHTWAKEYDRQLTSLLLVESEVATEISDEIQGALGESRAAPVAKALQPVLSPEQSEAHDLYLRGLYFWNKRNADDFRRAIAYFEQAVAKDPNDARSYAGIADSYVLLGGYTAEARPEYMIKARDAAMKAIALDNNLAEAHTALALIVQNYDRDWQTAENEYRRAIRANPNYATAHHWYAEHLGFLGRFEEAFRESERARQLDPLSLIIAADHCMLLVESRQYDRAIEKARSALEMDPNFAKAGDCLVRAYAAKNKFREALAWFEPARYRDDNPYLWSWRAYLYGRWGQHNEARHALDRLTQLYEPDRTDPIVSILASLGFGDSSQTMAWLEKAWSQHSNVIPTLKVDPLFDPLRSDPRFQDLTHRAGLAP